MQSNEENFTMPTTPDHDPWHALYTRHHHEKVVAQALTGKGFEIFFPQYQAVHQWKDRQKELMLPLFPNYVFIHGGMDRMLKIVTTPGVHSVVSWGSRPADIPSQEIEMVRRLVDNPAPVTPDAFINCGDRVRVTAGPLKGMQGILVRRTRGARLVLSIQMLSKSASVEVDLNVVEPVREGEVETSTSVICAIDSSRETNVIAR